VGADPRLNRATTDIDCFNFYICRHVSRYATYFLYEKERETSSQRWVKGDSNPQDQLAQLNFMHRASCILGQEFRYSPENAFYIFNQQIYFII